MILSKNWWRKRGSSSDRVVRFDVDFAIEYTRVPDYLDCDPSLIRKPPVYVSKQKDLIVLKRIRDGDVSHAYSDSGASRIIQEGSLCE